MLIRQNPNAAPDQIRKPSKEKGLEMGGNGIANAALSQLSYIPKHRNYRIKQAFSAIGSSVKTGELW